MKKRIIVNGVEMFYCPDCDDYRFEEDMEKSKAYCTKHANIRKLKSYHRKKQWKKDNYQIESTDHKYYFKGANRIKSVSVRPRECGVCVNWVKPRYERMDWIDNV